MCVFFYMALRFCVKFDAITYNVAVANVIFDVMTTFINAMKRHLVTRASAPFWVQSKMNVSRHFLLFYCDGITSIATINHILSYILSVTSTWPLGRSKNYFRPRFKLWPIPLFLSIFSLLLNDLNFFIFIQHLHRDPVDVLKCI